MASPKSHRVSQSVGWSSVPWQLEGPPWPPAVTQKAAAENRKAWDSCDKPLANKAGGCRLPHPPAPSPAPQLYVAFLDFFFFSVSNSSEFSPWPSFICGKILSERDCWDVVWACIPEEGRQSVCTQRMEKMFPCFKDYWTHSFQNESIPSSRDNFH